MDYSRVFPRDGGYTVSDDFYLHAEDPGVYNLESEFGNINVAERLAKFFQEFPDSLIIFGEIFTRKFQEENPGTHCTVYLKSSKGYTGNTVDDAERELNVEIRGRFRYKLELIQVISSEDGENNQIMFFHIGDEDGLYYDLPIERGEIYDANMRDFKAQSRSAFRIVIDILAAYGRAFSAATSYSSLRELSRTSYGVFRPIRIGDREEQTFESALGHTSFRSSVAMTDETQRRNAESRLLAMRGALTVMREIPRIFLHSTKALLKDLAKNGPPGKYRLFDKPLLLQTYEGDRGGAAGGGGGAGGP